MNKRLQERIYRVLNKDVRTPDNTTQPEETDAGDIYGISDPNGYIQTLQQNLQENYTLRKLNTNILGMPHQFLETTDYRIDENCHFGYGFFDHIYIEKPIVTLMPGKMLFLPNYSKSKKKIFASVMTDGSDNAKNVLADLTEEGAGSRYYDFTGDYTAYMNYVNLMCRVAAVYLGIEDLTAPDGKSKYKTYDWKNYQTEENYVVPESTKDNKILRVAKNFFEQVKDDVTVGQRCYVNFYIDPNTSVNESISNTTQASQLEGAFDSLEGIVKEADMLMKTVGGTGVQEFFDTAESAVVDLANGVTLGLFKNILGLGEEVLHGSNLIYPEIWTESDYSKSFSVQINLASPYGSKEAIYLNILVPMFHLLCLALPRQTTENSYNAPFLIRGYSQGWFSIDMGMVESISIDKGPEQSWNVEGLPTQAKVTLSIKELYGNLMMSSSTKPSYFFANQGLIDYLGVACGVDMSIPNIYFNYRLACSMLSSYFKDIPNNLYYQMTSNVREFLNGIFN
jgi:hypothetical protein